MSNLRQEGIPTKAQAEFSNWVWDKVGRTHLAYKICGFN